MRKIWFVSLVTASICLGAISLSDHELSEQRQVAALLSSFYKQRQAVSLRTYKQPYSDGDQPESVYALTHEEARTFILGSRALTSWLSLYGVDDLSEESSIDLHMCDRQQLEIITQWLSGDYSQSLSRKFERQLLKNADLLALTDGTIAHKLKQLSDTEASHLWLEDSHVATPLKPLALVGELFVQELRSRTLFCPHPSAVLGIRNLDELEGAHDGPVRALALSPDNRLLIVGSRDGTLSIWREDRVMLWRFMQRIGPIYNEDGPTRSAVPIKSLACAPAGGTIACGLSDCTIVVGKITPDGTCELRRRLGAVKNQEPDHGHIARVNSLVFLPNGGLASGSSDTTVLLWHEDDMGHWHIGERLGASGNEDSVVGHVGEIHGIGILPDGSSVITGSADHTLIVWKQNASGSWYLAQRLGKIFNEDKALGHTSAVSCFAVSSDGKQLISGDSAGSLVIWEQVADGSWCFKQRLEAQIEKVSNILLVAADRVLLTIADRSITMWRQNAYGVWCNQQCLGAQDNEDLLNGHVRSIRAAVYATKQGMLITGANDHAVLVWQREKIDDFCLRIIMSSEQGTT